MTSGTAPSIPQGADRDKVLKALRIGQDYEDAVGLLGVPDRTAWHWWNKGKELANGGTHETAHTRAEYVDLYREWYQDCRKALSEASRGYHAVIASGAKGDKSQTAVQSASIWLRHRSKAWKQRHEVTGAEGGPLEVRTTIARGYPQLEEDDSE